MNTKYEIQYIHSFHKLYLQHRTLEILESNQSTSIWPSNKLHVRKQLQVAVEEKTILLLLLFF